MATPCGVVPTEMGLPSNWPNVGLAGLRSTFTMLLHPETLIKPNGEKGPLTIWSAMAMELGCVLTALPLESVQTLDRSTDLMTMKPVTLDCAPLLTTSSA